MKIGFIGAGNMATAIIGGLLSAGTAAGDICVFDTDEAKLQVFSDKGVCTAQDSLSLTKICDIVVLAVKPQNYSDVLAVIKDEADVNKTFVSIAAGITIDFVRRGLGVSCPVVRVMPNTPMLLGKGASALCFSENVIPEVRAQVTKMFSSGGVTEEFSEEYMDAIISIHGSSPAYFYLFAKSMADYAESVGIDRDKAMNLICATMEGSAQMLRSSGDDAQTLIDKVSSKGGTTIEALKKFYDHDIANIFNEAMSACTKRAGELAAES